MKPFRGEAAGSVPATPVPGAHERGTVWSANATPASSKSYTTTPLFGSATPSVRTNMTTESSSSNGILSQSTSSMLESFAPFPANVADALKRLPAYDAAHLAGGLDVQSGFAWVVMNDVNFKAQRKLMIWNYQVGASVGTSRTRPGASSDVFQLTMPGSVSDPMPTADLIAIVSSTSLATPSASASFSNPSSGAGDLRNNLSGFTSSSSSSSSVMGVVAASTNGQLRYWPRMTEIHRCTDATVQLQAYETCVSLRALHGAPVYILATSTGRLILIAFQGSHSVLQREIKSQKSMFKKVGSWLGFGRSTQNVASEQRLVGLRVSAHADGSAHLWLLKADSLQIWYFDNQSRESLVFDKNILEEFESQIYGDQEQQFGGKIPLDLTVADFQIRQGDPHNPGYLCLLIGSIPAEIDDIRVQQYLDQRGDHGEYHLAVYETKFSSTRSLASVDSARLQLINVLAAPEELAASPEFPMLLLPQDEPVVYIHWENFSLPVSLPDGSDSPMEIEDITKNPSYRIFGSGSLGNAALYFTPNHGIVKFRLLATIHSPIVSDEAHGERKTGRGALSSAQTSGFMAQASAEDILSEAFQRYLNQTSSQHLSSPASSYPWSPLIDLLWDLNYAEAVKSLTLRIADGRPTEDPRWPELGGDHQNSLLIQSFLHRQIEEKQNTLEIFIQFLGEVEMWNGLPLAIIDFVEQTAERLAGAGLLRARHNELVLAATTSQQQQQQQRQRVPSTSSTPRSGSATSLNITSGVSQNQQLVIFNQAIEAALHARGILRNQWERDGLGAQDIFYAQISKIESILEPALATLKAQMTQKLSQESQFTLISQANFLFESIILAAQDYRHKHAPYPIQLPDGEFYPTELMRSLAARSTTPSSLGAPWTYACHTSLREMARVTRQFIEQVKQSKAAASQRTLGKGFASSTDIDVQLLDDQLYRLSEALLADMQQEIFRCEGEASVEELKAHFVTIRTECIAPFKADSALYKYAFDLAEKYQDFGALIEICQATNDDARLWRYAEQFKEDRFEIVVFEFFFVNKQYHKLLSPPRIYWSSLTEYLQDTPQANFLSWVHQIQTKDFRAAEQTFNLLAQSEVQSAFKQTTLLSLAKISHFAQLGTAQQQARAAQEAQDIEERQQKLYQLDAQLHIRAMFDKTDDDAPPASSSALVSRLLDAVHGNDVLEAGFSVTLALDLYRNTTLLRSDYGNKEMLKTIWHRVLSLEHWNELADSAQHGEIDDDSLRVEIERSMFFRTAFETHSLEDELPSDLFIEVVKSFHYNAATLRTLATAVSLVYEVRGLAQPDMSEILVSGEAQAKQNAEEAVVIEDDDDDDDDDDDGEEAQEGPIERTDEDSAPEQTELSQEETGATMDES